MAKLRAGVVGKNYSGKFLTPCLRALNDYEVSAICTAHEGTARQAAKDFDIGKAYWSSKDFVADPEIDVIVAGTKPSVRQDIVLDALSAGKHVFSCIPFATSEAKARELCDVARAKKLVGVVDAQWRWVPAIRFMKEIYEAGGIGEFWTASIQLYLSLWEKDGARYTECSWSGLTDPYPWLSEADSGGSAWRNFGSHSFLNLMYLFGEIEEVVGATKTFLKEMTLPDGSTVRPETPDFGWALVRFKNGGIANVNVSWAAADAPGYRLDVYGSKGRMLAEEGHFCGAGARLYVGGVTPPEEFAGRNGDWVEIPDRFWEVEGRVTRGDPTTPYRAMFSDMARAIRSGVAGSPSFAEAYHAHCAVEALVRSAETRRWVTVAEMADAGVQRR